MEWIRFAYLLLGALLRPSNAQFSVPDTVLNCCEGDILVLLDSSGSVSSYDFLRLLHFLSELFQPFSLGHGQVRVGLLQVGTKPHLEFGLDVYNTQSGLQGALQGTRHLQGDTNTEAALQQALEILTKARGKSVTQAGRETKLPKVLLWMTDGVQPGDVHGPMAELRKDGVAVLVVSTGHGNYQMLWRLVTPPIESHLYFVDIEDISIISEDLREAIIELIRSERLQVMQVTSSSVVLQWRDVLSANTGFYELRYSSVDTHDGATSSRQLTLPGGSSWVKLTNLHPETTYTASLTPESNRKKLNTLTVTFTTLPEVLSPAVVSVSESGPNSVHVSWGPLQPDRVQRYRVEYGAIPSGQVQTVSLRGHENSTLLTGLQPGTQYLVTVSALYFTSKEKAMSARVCTQEVLQLPALTGLQLIPLGRAKVQVQWHGQQEGLRGYWLSWQRSDTQSSSNLASSSLYLPPGSSSTRLTHLAPSSRVCVSPIYSSGRGDGLCCTAHTNADTDDWSHQ